MAALLVTSLFVGGLLAFGIGVLAWALYLQPKWDGERWARAANALGLALEPRTGAHRIGLYGSGPTILQQMIGERGGVPVRVGIRVVIVGGGRNRQRVYYTYVEAALPRSLELGLSVSRSSWLGGVVSDLFGAGDLRVGHPALDSAYRITATVADQARALLSVPYVAEALLALSGSAFEPNLSDTTVKLEARQKCFDARALDAVLEQTVEITHRVVSARSSLGPSYVQRVMAEAWRPIAEARGLALDLEQLTMWGRVDGVHVEVRAMQRGDACSTAFLVRFDRALGLGLSLERQSGFSKLGALIGMQDIETGDPTFDARFVVKGRPVDAVRAALTPDVRARLVQLQEQATSLTVKDDLLCANVGWLVSEPAWLHAGIAAVARAGAALVGAGEVGAGPYRR